MYISSPFTTAPSPEGREEKENKVYSFLQDNGIAFYGVSHDQADTMEICEQIEGTLGAEICKNLFLCNAQATTFYLLLMPGKKAFKTKFLSKQINSSRLSFGSVENMEKYLGVTPGSVSIMGLLNDEDKRVNLLIDKDLLSLDAVGVHPCINTSTIKISLEDMINRVIPSLGRSYTVVDLPDPDKIIDNNN